jgi:AcrR family transcriptional regulator
MTGSSQAAGRERILEQARHLFARHGYHGVSVRDIAQASGLSNAALYYHFGSKEGLYFEVLRSHVATVASRLQEAAAGEAICRQRLSRVAHAYARIILESRGVVQTLLRDLAQFDEEEIRQAIPEAVRRIPSVIAEILEQGIADGEIRAIDTYRVGELMLGMINSLVARRLYTVVEATLEEDLDLAINVLFEGIRP